MEPHSTPVEEPTEREERDGTDDEQQAELSRAARTVRCKEGLCRHLTTFQMIYQQLTDAALKFREQLALSPRACRDVLNTLQTLRKETNACLAFFGKSGVIFPHLPSYYAAINTLYLLDGERTAQLTLEVDLFLKIVIESYNESLSHARQRIAMHVALQSSLKDETRYLRELLGTLEKLLTETPLPRSLAAAAAKRGNHRFRKKGQDDSTWMEKNAF